MGSKPVKSEKDNFIVRNKIIIIRLENERYSVELFERLKKEKINEIILT